MTAVLLRFVTAFFILLLLSRPVTAQPNQMDSLETITTDSRDLRQRITGKMQTLDNYLALLADSAQLQTERDLSVRLAVELFQSGCQIRVTSQRGQKTDYRIDQYLNQLAAKLTLHPETMRLLADARTSQCEGYIVEGQYGWRIPQSGLPRHGLFQCRVYVYREYDSFLQATSLIIRLGNIALN